LEEERFRYYKLSRPGGEPFHINHPKAIYSSPNNPGKADLLWKEVEARTINSKSRSIYEFDLKGHYPVSAISMNFPESNGFAAVEIATKSGTAWHWLQRASFFSRKEGNETFAVAERRFPERTARYWRMSLESDKAGIGSRFPKVSFGWRAGTLAFERRGEGPFTLAYGSARVVNPPKTDLLEDAGKSGVGTATTGGTSELGGKDQLKTPQQVLAAYNGIILWSIGAAAVLLIAEMIVRARRRT
jgi:hypothetical protein